MAWSVTITGVGMRKVPTSTATDAAEKKSCVLKFIHGAHTKRVFLRNQIGAIPLPNFYTFIYLYNLSLTACPICTTICGEILREGGGGDSPSSRDSKWRFFSAGGLVQGRRVPSAPLRSLHTYALGFSKHRIPK